MKNVLSHGCEKNYWLLHMHKSTKRQITDDGSDGARRVPSLVTHAFTVAQRSLFSESVQVCAVSTFTVRPALLTLCCYRAEVMKEFITALILRGLASLLQLQGFCSSFLLRAHLLTVRANKREK